MTHIDTRNPKMIVSTIVVLCIVAGGAFYTGVRYDQSARLQLNAQGQSAALSPQDRQARFQQYGAGGRGGTRNGPATTGVVIAKDSSSITVKMQDGGSKIVFYSNETPVMKTVAGSAADIAIGQDVTAIGTQNTDGSITAQSIQIRPSQNTRAQP